MKTARTLITICLFLTAASVFAQMRSSQQLMKVNIPFAFGVEDQSLPAGQYLVFTVTPERSIRLTSTDGKHSAIVNDLPNHASEPSQNSRLVFHRYGNEYFLAEVWTAGQDVARNPLSSKRAMESASNGEKPETFTVVALADRR
jgi:hypothetical protein